MTSASPPGFTYVNREGVWRDFTLHDLDVDGDSLTLARLPALVQPLPADVAALLPRDAAEPAGIAVAADGSIFFTNPEVDGIGRVDGCDGAEAPVPCIGGHGETPPAMASPTGVAVHADRGALFVAGTGNHRLQVFDLTTFQLLDVWGDGGYAAPAGPSAAAGRFDTPVGVATDAAGSVYVAERGNRRVQQFTAGGQVVASFWATLSAQVTFGDPVAIATTGDRDHTRVFVLDREPATLLVVDGLGRVLAQLALDLPGEPLGVAVSARAIYIGVNAATGGSVVRLRGDGSIVGAAAGYTGAVAGLALDIDGGLLVHPGWSRAPIRLVLDAAHVQRGYAFGGPFGGFVETEKHWHQLRASMPDLPPGAHAQFFVHTTDDADEVPPVGTHPEPPFAEPAWSAGHPDLSDLLIGADDAVLAWVGFVFSSEGTNSPAVEQIRLDFDHPTYVEHLPHIYRESDDTRAFLPRYLALVESLFAEVEDETDGLTRLLDAAAAPHAFLLQLAQWLAVDVATGWDDAELRDAVADAYVDAASRGTVGGLRAALRRATGIDARIEEPLLQSAWWALAQSEESTDAERATSVLGVTTMLAASEPQGAVLGSTATVNRSHLITNDDYGVPLFDDVAHRFVVRLFEGAAMSDDRLRSVRAVLDRERPAHTEYVVCRVDPRLAIGVQSRIGVDAIVGGDPLPGSLDGDASLDGRLVLGGDPVGRIGERSDIGVTTVLGHAAVGN